MKLSAIIVLLLFPFYNQLYGQIQIRAKGGLVLSSLVRDSNMNLYDGRIGYLLGVNAKIDISDLGWYLQSGIDYANEGDSELTLNFLKVPLIIGLDISDGTSVFMIYNLAWNLDKSDAEGSYSNFANMLGFGIEFALSTKTSFGSSLSYGLSNLVQDPDVAMNFNIKPLTFNLYLVYRIN